MKVNFLKFDKEIKYCQLKITRTARPQTSINLNPVIRFRKIRIARERILKNVAPFLKNLSARTRGHIMMVKYIIGPIEVSPSLAAKKKI